MCIPYFRSQRPGLILIVFLKSRGFQFNSMNYKQQKLQIVLPIFHYVRVVL